MENQQDNVQIGKVIGNKFKLEDKIGQGSFGMIFKCLNLENGEHSAIKLEKRNSKHSSMLVREIKVMMEVKSENGFAKLMGYGKEDDFNFVAMTYLGRNLDSLLKKCGGKFTLPCTVNVFEQCLKLLRILHTKNLIHRDIKPENFVIGYDPNFNIVHLIDFGLAKFYIDQDGNHIPYFSKKGMIGTARYASLNAHLGYEQSRRDDLEGLGYVMIYLAKGKLPWQTIVAENKDEKYEKIKQMKQTMTTDQMCEGLHKSFSDYFKYVKDLEFSEAPDYDYLLQLLYKITDNQLEKKDLHLRNVDWEILPEYKVKRKFQQINIVTNNTEQVPNNQAKNQNQNQLQNPNQGRANEKKLSVKVNGTNPADRSPKQRNSLISNQLLVPNQLGDNLTQQPSIMTSCGTSRVNHVNFTSQQNSCQRLSEIDLSDGFMNDKKQNDENILEKQIEESINNNIQDSGDYHLQYPIRSINIKNRSSYFTKN